jgi:hypothetical protein
MAASSFERAALLPGRFAKKMLDCEPDSPDFVCTRAVDPPRNLKEALIGSTQEGGVDDEEENVLFSPFGSMSTFAGEPFLVPGGRYLFAPVVITGEWIISLWDLGPPGKRLTRRSLVASVRVPGLYGAVAHLRAVCPTACGTGLRVIAKMTPRGSGLVVSSDFNFNLILNFLLGTHLPTYRYTRFSRRRKGPNLMSLIAWRSPALWPPFLSLCTISLTEPSSLLNMESAFGISEKRNQFVGGSMNIAVR